MKTLHLNLKRKWFDMILSGEKKEEYREVKIHWIRQLLKPPFSNMNGNLFDVEFDLATTGPNIFKNFDTITFSNGYAKNRDQFTIELKGIDVKTGKPELGAEEGKKYFVLSLGEIINQKFEQ